MINQILKKGNKEMMKSKLFIFTITIILSVIILILTLRLWEADLTIPFSYEGDGLSVASYFKGVIDNNSVIENKFIGTPSSLKSVETPMSDWFHIIMIRIITLIVNEPYVALNIFYLLTFPLTVITSLMVFFKFKANLFFSMIGSLLYAFIPYHFMRGENHLFLSAYYIVPIAIMLILEICDDKELFQKFDKKSNKYKFDLINLKSLKIFILGILISSSGVYYSFFTCFFLVVSGIIVGFRKKNMIKWLSSIIIILIILFGTILNLIPHIIYSINNKEVVESVERSKVESEIYGLKISQLILPITGHRIEYIANKKDAYDSEAPLINENGTASLGIVGSIGFLISLIYVYIGKKDNLIKDIGLLNLSAILLASIGGFSTIFAFLVTDMIRSYNRISVFISFFSIFLIVYILGEIYNSCCKNIILKRMMLILGGFILILGIYDETSVRYVPNYYEIRTQFNADKKFIEEIEKNAPENTMIFQLPYIPFPEVASPYKMGYYDMLKPYLHSNKLYWSYGSIKGKENDLWQKEVSSKEPEEFIKNIYDKGFRGIFIDSYGYENEETFNKLVEDILNLTNTIPIYSENGRYIYIELDKNI